VTPVGQVRGGYRGVRLLHRAVPRPMGSHGAACSGMTLRLVALLVTGAKVTGNARLCPRAGCFPVPEKRKHRRTRALAGAAS
jgi:hypothetical protein